MKQSFMIILLNALALTWSTGTASAAWHTPYTEGKEALAEQGIEAEAVYVGEFWANTRGGIKRDTTYLGNLDLTLTLDTEKLGLWKNGTFFVYVLDNHGDEKLTGEIVGDLQAVSNIEAPRSTRLFEIWYEHQLFDQRGSILVGIHDLNSEFAVTEYGGLYINSSFGIGAEMAAGARPAIFPLAALGTRVKFQPNEQWDVLIGLYDGNPGDPEISEHLPRSVLADDQGMFLILETAYHFDLFKADLPGTVKLGAWHNTGEFDDLVDTNSEGTAITHDDNSGGYLILDQMLFREQDEQGLGAFFQFGFAPEDINEVDYYLGGGLNYHGLIPGRDQDDLGIAVGHASISNELTNRTDRDNSETVIELTYRAQLCDNFAIQPDLQWIINPGADEALENAFVAGLRFELAL